MVILKDILKNIQEIKYFKNIFFTHFVHCYVHL